jgi:hypothetical protein
MTRWQFFWAIVAWAFHGTFRILEITEATLALLVHALSWWKPAWEEPLRITFVVLLGILICTFAFALFEGAFKVARRLEQINPVVLQSLTEERDALKGQINAVYGACDQIFTLGKHNSISDSLILEEDWLFVIDQDGTARAQHRVTFQARDRVTCLRRYVGSDTSISMRTLAFSAVATNERKVAILPTRDFPTEKVLLLFLLPEIEASDQPTDHSVTVSWTWPKMFQGICPGNTGEDSWTLEGVKSGADVPRIRFRFKLHPDLPYVRLTNTLQGGGQQLPNTPRDEHGYREFTWEMTDVKPGSKVGIQLAIV